MTDKPSRDLQYRHAKLLREYGETKARVKAYSARRYLTPGEQMEHKTLQRVKLYKKDALAALESQMAAISEAAQG